MVTQLEAYNHYQQEYDEGTIYVWGFNDGTIINEETIAKAYKEYGSASYNKEYYAKKLKEGKGKNGADCSGAHYLLSGYDTTAQGYYEKCTKTGKISTLPKDKVALLFVESVSKDPKTGKETRKMVHTGAWLPNKGAFHMRSSVRNCVIEDGLGDRGWTHWGYANFISDYDTYSFGPDPEPTPGPDPRKYTQDDFIRDVCLILGVKNAKEAFNKTKTISKNTNKYDALVTPLERYMKALEYYSGSIEEDLGKKPNFGSGMEAAIKQYQKEIVKATEKNQDGVVTKKQATWKKLLGLS